MTEMELGERSKEALSWMVIAEVLRISKLNLDVAVLHPGGGQYDTLSLVTYEGKAVIHLNRNGQNALAGGELVENVFFTAAKSPEKAAQKIVAKLKIDAELPMASNQRTRIGKAVEIADFLTFNLSNDGRCEWGWTDSEYGVGPNPELSRFEIPESWKSLKPPFSRTGWEAAIFLLFKKTEPFAAVNMITGELCSPQGKSLDGLLYQRFKYEGLPRPKLGTHMTFKNSDGKVLFDQDVHASMTRMSRRIYSEEYLVLPEETEISEFAGSQEDAVSIWNNAEGNFGEL